jgi:hypothetical protein
MASTDIPPGGLGPLTGAVPHGIDRASLRLDFWLFVLMLVLALIGVGVTQIEHSGPRVYWVFLVLVYGGIGTALAWVRAKRRGAPVWPMIRGQALHWLGTLAAIKIVLLFEATGVTDRAPASDYSLLILALSCYLAGVHLNWTFRFLGALLAVIAVGLGYLDQLSVFALALPLALLAVWIALKRKVGSESRP